MPKYRFTGYYYTGRYTEYQGAEKVFAEYEKELSEQHASYIIKDGKLTRGFQNFCATEVATNKFREDVRVKAGTPMTLVE